MKQRQDREWDSLIQLLREKLDRPLKVTVEVGGKSFDAYIEDRNQKANVDLNVNHRNLRKEGRKMPKPLTPREYFNFLQAKFGKTYLTKKFNVRDHAVERWTADEKYVGEESVRKNPIEKIEETLHDLMDRGHLVEAQAMVARWARIVGCEVMDCDEL